MTLSLSGLTTNCDAILICNFNDRMIKMCNLEQQKDDKHSLVCCHLNMTECLHRGEDFIEFLALGYEKYHSMENQHFW